eukprot:GHRQ01013692.1.p1 GENE.GHRQ01013692.1~~GHRQ01013692.1.p1  ORF type:complete len:334 (+),score=108.18 GHRQ01013692.1:163-1164(+)
MFSKATHWLIEGLLNRERQAAAVQQSQEGAAATAGSDHDVVTERANNGIASDGGKQDNSQGKDDDVESLPDSEYEEEEGSQSPQQRRSTDTDHQPSIITTHLQLGRQSFSRTAPSIFELSRNSSVLGSFQEALSQDAAAVPDLSPRFSSSSSRLFSPRVSLTQLAALDSLSAAAAFSRSISLRHTPTLAQLPAPVQEVLDSCGALFIENGNIEGLAEAASHFIAESGISETFYVYDLGEVARLHNTWRAAMPRVAPHYAVKCNPEPMMLAMLAALGAGFDCASVMELEAAQALGVSQDRIIFANPCKKPADFRCAADMLRIRKSTDIHLRSHT